MQFIQICVKKLLISYASKAGLQLSEAQIALQALATDTNGFLEVKFLILFSFFMFGDDNVTNFV